MGIFDAIRAASAKRDPDGQAPSPRYRAAAVADRDVDELIGIVKGVLADGQVTKGEASFLLEWMESHANVRDDWPISVLYPRVVSALRDGVVSADEESELLGLLASAVGKNGPTRGVGSMSTALPVNDPAPKVEFDGHTFCFTGKFYSGTRDWCESQVLERGGTNVAVSKKLSYLVIGEIGSRDWIHSTHGRKIEKAVMLRGDGIPIAIVAEEHWAHFLGR